MRLKTGISEKIEQLMRSVQAGRIVHAFLFVGPYGTGKRTAARYFAQALLCEGENKPCGVCPACKQFEAGLHPDVRFVRAETNTLKVDAIRELIEYLSMHTYEGGMRVAIIERAEQMNESAQNALLKTLESPPENVMIFLLTDTPGALLNTIVSRCQTVRFQEPSVEDCAAALEARGIAPQRAKLLAGLAQGSVGRAVDMDADAAFFDRRDRVLRSLEMLKAPADVAEAASLLAKDKGSERDDLDIMELWARDLMAMQNGQTPFELPDADRLKRSRFRGKTLLLAVMDARQRLSANLSWVNVLESMYFGLLK